MATSTVTREQGILYGYLIFTVGLLYLYFQKAPFAHFVDTWNEYFESALVFPTTYSEFIPAVSLLDFAGSIFVCKKYRSTSHGEKSWFEILLACILMQFGGTLIIGFILGQVPSWILSRNAIPGFILAWWLTFYSPQDFFWNTVSNNSVLLFFFGILGALSSGHAVTTWGLDKAYWNTFHVNGSDFSKSYFLCILCGTLAASGGGILCELFNFFSHSRSFTLRHKTKFFEINNYAVSGTVNRSFWLALVYYLLIATPQEVGPFSFQLQRVTAHSIIALLQVSAYLMGNHIPQLDIYQEFSNFVLDSLHISTSFSFSPSSTHNEEEAEETADKKRD